MRRSNALNITNADYCHLMDSGAWTHWHKHLLSKHRLCWLDHHNTLPKFATVLIGIIVFPMMAVYIAVLIYLMFRKDTVVTFVDPTNIAHDPQAQLEIGRNGAKDALPEPELVPSD